MGEPNGGPLASTVKVAEEMVNGFMASLKVALTALLRATPVARSTGKVRVIVGGVATVDPVVKVHT